MRWLDSARRTGGSRRTGKTFQVKSNQEGFAFDAGKNKIGGVWGARSGAGVHTRLGNALQETLLQFVAEVGDTPGVFCQRFAGDSGSFAKPYISRDVFGAGTEAALGMAAIEKLAQARSATNVQCADALWRIQFVSGNGEEIDAQRIYVNWDFACGLHGVGVEVNVRILGDAADLFERLDCAELVVGVHDGDENRFGPDGAAKVSEINLAIGIRCKVSEANAALFERLASVQHRFMFDGAGNHMLFVATRSFNDSEDGVVVGFGATAGEDDFLGARADQCGNLFARCFHSAAGTLTGSVDGSSVAKFLGEIGQHGVEHFRLDRRGGVEIEIDAVHGAIHRILPAGVRCLHEVGVRTSPQD